MKILIHALGANMGGAIRHLTNFLPQLSRHDVSNDYVVLTRKSFPVLGLGENIRIERIEDGVCSSWMWRISKDLLELPLRLKREHFSAVVSLANFGPIWTSVPHILFQRNSIYYYRPHFREASVRMRAETALRRRLAIESMKRADVVVTPSHAMANMIRESCPSVRRRPFRTLYHGLTLDSSAQQISPEIDHILSRGKGVKILYPTHPAPHKGFDVLFDMLAKIKSNGLPFCLFTTISIDDWPQGVRKYERRVRELGLKDNVVFMGRVPQQQMACLYKRCDLMIYPSLCESFGFSMLEAMGYRLPIVAADTAVNREICQEAAKYYPPLNAEVGAKILEESLHPRVLQRLREQAQHRINSLDWSWGRYAREFVEIIENVA